MNVQVVRERYETYLFKLLLVVLLIVGGLAFYAQAEMRYFNAQSVEITKQEYEALANGGPVRGARDGGRRNRYNKEVRKENLPNPYAPVCQRGVCNVPKDPTGAQLERRRNYSTVTLRATLTPADKFEQRPWFTNPDGFRKGYNTSMRDKGYGIKIHKFVEGGGRIRYDYTINMPCFYTAPNDTPCDRGRLGK